MVAFPCKNGAPVTGITLSARVGRLSRTHFELGFSVNAIVSMGKRRWNGKVERSAESVLFNTGFTTSANGGGGQQLLCSGKPVCGESIMWNHHETNQRSRQRVQQFRTGRYTMRRPALLHHELTASSLGNVCQSCIAPLPVEKWWGKTLCPGWDTHTHTCLPNR